MGFRSIQGVVAGTALVLGLATQAGAVELGRWNVQNFTSAGGTWLSALTVAAIAPTVGSLNNPARGAGTIANGGTNGYYTRDFTAAGSLANAVAVNEYIEFSVNSVFPYWYDFTSLTFSDTIAGNGPTRIAVRTSLNGYSTDLPLSSDVVSAAPTQRTVNLTGLSSLGIGFTTSFRIYGYSAGDTAGRYVLTSDAVVLSGNVMAPEPGSAVLALLGLGATGVRVRRRR